ncbi:hypothetical protein [Actinoplanes sp. DH11]|uniref:hypothetical protein n=1 Tax=Actinoplanes sp. DH11 TaxID=2857011 RepID=UPI001E4C183C|nr:hypothetical protein [Actinoplanes sp. DH11]
MTTAVLLLIGLTGCASSGNAADDAIDRTAAAIAREVSVALANLSPGDYGEGGVSYLTSAVITRRGEVLGSDRIDTIELDALQAWVDTRFTATASGGYLGKAQQSATRCLRFEVRWSYGDYVTHHPIDCPA